MKNPRLDSQQLAEVDSAGESHRKKQPYASELEDRELERAHKEKRPVKDDAQPRPAAKER